MSDDTVNMVRLQVTEEFTCLRERLGKELETDQQSIKEISIRYPEEKYNGEGFQKLSEAGFATVKFKDNRENLEIPFVIEE